MSIEGNTKYFVIFYVGIFKKKSHYTKIKVKNILFKTIKHLKKKLKYKNAMQVIFQVLLVHMLHFL